MESYIILEGFKQSVEVHRLRYIRIIGDGDSSVYNKLLREKPYANQCVEKVECRNHLRLGKLNDRTASKFNSKRISKDLRTQVVNSIRRILTDRKMAVQYRIKKEKGFLHQKFIYNAMQSSSRII